MRGKAADPCDGNKCACALCERGFGNVRTSGSGSGVLASGHVSIVACPVTPDDARHSAGPPAEKWTTLLGIVGHLNISSERRTTSSKTSLWRRYLRSLPG